MPHHTVYERAKSRIRRAGERFRAPIGGTGSDKKVTDKNTRKLLDQVDTPRSAAGGQRFDRAREDVLPEWQKKKRKNGGR